MDINFIKQQLNGLYFENFKSDNPDEICRFNVFIKKNVRNINMNFWITIVLLKGYPEICPKVFDYSNIIPKDLHNRFHVNQDNSLCLTHPIDLYKKYNNKMTLYEFINEFVISYYYQYFCYKQTGKIEEYSHSIFGDIEAIKKYLHLDISKNYSCKDIYNILIKNKNKFNFMPEEIFIDLMKRIETYKYYIEINKYNASFQNMYEKKHSLYSKLVKKNSVQS